MQTLHRKTRVQIKPRKKPPQSQNCFKNSSRGEYCTEKRVLNEVRTNIFMQIKQFFLQFQIFSALHATVQATLPSEHSVAPEIWTDILGAFSQKHSKQSLRCITRHQYL